LLGATKNGHALVFGRGGAILDRYQLHLGSITQMLFDEHTSCLYTSGLDDYIRISVVKPLHPDIIQIKIEIQTNFVPRLLCPMGNIVACTADDASIHMFEVNLAKQEWKIMMGHPKMHDHTQRVNTLVCCRNLGIFLSSGLDNSLRIWNHQNKLIREILFQEPLESICIANEKGDALLAMGNRVDLIKCELYLPPAYLKAVSKIPKGVKEIPIVFDDSLIPFTRSQTFQLREREKLVFDKTSPLEIFCIANLAWFDRVSNIRRRALVMHASSNPNIHSRMSTIIEDEVELFLKRVAAQIRQRTIDKENREQARLKELEERRKELEEIPEVTVGRSLLKEFDLMLPKLPQIEPFKKSSEDIDSEDEDDFGLFSISQNGQKIPRLLIAPDGYVPNTMVEKDATKWLHEHGYADAVPSSFKSRKKKKEGNKKDSDREARSREYRMKLKEKMKELIEEEQVAPPPEPVPLVEEPKTKVMEVELKKQVIEMVLPETIEKFMSYDWFPEELVFYPEGFEPSPLTETICTTSKGKVTRVPKMSGRADDVYPIVLRVFGSLPNNKKSEALGFLKWLKAKHGFENSIPFQRYIIARLDPMKIANSEDMKLRMEWIDWMLELNPTNTDFLLVLLHYTTCLYDSLKNRAIQIISSMGMPCITHPFIANHVERMCQEIRQSEMNPSIHQEVPKLVELFDRFFKTGIRNYLIFSCTDLDQGKKLVGQDQNPTNEAEKGTSAKKGKKKEARRNSQKVMQGGTSETLLPQSSPPSRDFKKETPDQAKENGLAVQKEIIDMRTRVFPNAIDERQFPKV
jgi:hypothetical protein